MACHFCHEGYPKLNPKGQRFKERGFRMEQEDAFDAARWIARCRWRCGRTSAASSSKTGTIRARLHEGRFAGNLGTRLSYWVDDAILISEGDDNVNHVEPDNAWLPLEVVSGQART